MTCPVNDPRWRREARRCLFSFGPRVPRVHRREQVLALCAVRMEAMCEQAVWNEADNHNTPCARPRLCVFPSLFAVVSLHPPRPPLAPHSPLFVSDLIPHPRAVVAVQRVSLSRATCPSPSQVPYHGQTAAASISSDRALHRISGAFTNDNPGQQ